MLHKISDRVYYMDFVQQGDRPVLGLVVGNDCSLVIDGGNSKAHAEKFLNYVNKLDIPKIKYLVLTHWHWDHVWGMSTMGLINIVQKESNKRLQWMRTLEWTDKAIKERVDSGEEIEFCEEHIKIEHPNNNRIVEIPKADIIFDKNIEIDLGGVKVAVNHIATDHSEDCCLVNIKEDNVVFIGDAMYLDMYNGPWSYTREKLYNLLDRLEECNANYYIPAHHPKYTKEEFSAFIKYIKDLGDIVEDEINLEKAINKYKLIKNKEITKYEIDDISGFIQGNIKNRKY